MTHSTRSSWLLDWAGGRNSVVEAAAEPELSSASAMIVLTGRYGRSRWLALDSPEPATVHVADRGDE